MRQPKELESRRPSHLVMPHRCYMHTYTHTHADATNGARAIMHTDGFAVYIQAIDFIANCTQPCCSFGKGGDPLDDVRSTAAYS